MLLSLYLYINICVHTYKQCVSAYYLCELVVLLIPNFVVHQCGSIRNVMIGMNDTNYWLMS